MEAGRVGCFPTERQRAAEPAYFQLDLRAGCFSSECQRAAKPVYFSALGSFFCFLFVCLLYFGVFLSFKGKALVGQHDLAETSWWEKEKLVNLRSLQRLTGFKCWQS